MRNIISERSAKLQKVPNQFCALVFLNSNIPDIVFDQHKVIHVNSFHFGIVAKVSELLLYLKMVLTNCKKYRERNDLLSQFITD